MKPGPARGRWLLAALMVAAAAAAMAPREEPAPATRGALTTDIGQPTRARASLPPLPDLDIDALARKPSRASVMDAFENRNWAPPPAAAKAPPPPPPPQAPPVPYVYMGKIMDDQGVLVFLTRQGRNHAVRAGDRLEGNYRVDEIRPGSMTLTYLPLGEKQTLAIGAPN